MKNIKIYAVLHNGRTGEESRKTELHTARIDEDDRRDSFGGYPCPTSYVTFK